MAKLVHAQTILEKEKLDRLKELSREPATKDALSTAVDFYIKSHSEETKPEQPPVTGEQK